MSTSEPSIDPNRPSAARIYDAYLGGTHNLAVDRAIAARTVELLPGTPLVAKANRAFLDRAVRHALGHGIRQFLDLGSGIPTERNVHEVARAEAPDTRVVYVDIDPTAVLYARHLIGDDPLTAAVQGDLREPERILERPEVDDLLDLDQPVAILLIAVLHFVPDTPTLTAALHTYHQIAAPGSRLAVTHVTGGPDPDAMDRVAGLYNRTGTPLVPRDEAGVAELFHGWDLVEPGVVPVPLWRPEPADDPTADPDTRFTLAGVGVR